MVSSIINAIEADVHEIDSDSGVGSASTPTGMLARIDEGPLYMLGDV